MRRMIILIAALLATLGVLTGCARSYAGHPSAAGGDPVAADPAAQTHYAHRDSPTNLEGLLEAIMQSAEAGNSTKAVAMARDTMPDRAALTKAIADDAPAGTLDALSKLADSVSTSSDSWLAERIKHRKPSQTRAAVYAATTEELAAYRPGSVAYREFPAEARDLARRGVLRAGTTFYEVEFTQPGKSSGLKFHMFFWDGSQWRAVPWTWGG